MPEAVSAGEPLQPTGLHAASPAADGLAAASNARELVLRPVTPGVAVGQPVIDPPPLVEPFGFEDPADPPAEIRPPAADRRPVRRRFLPPVPTSAVDRQDRPRPPRDVRPRLPAPLQLASADPADRPAGAPSALSSASATDARPADVGSTGATALRRWRRPVLVGAGVAVALALAAALEVGVSVDWLNRMRGLIVQGLAGSPRPSPTGVSPEAARRVTDYTDRAKAGDSEAQLALAILYAKGDGVAQDYTAAANWFRRAADKGLMRAQYDLGVLYERGRGVPEDHGQAVSWYRKAAEQNHPLAQYNLAVAFTKGEGVRRDAFEAAVWYHRAAAQGVVAAMVNLAILYERGEGVETSTVDAYAWYRAAARRGSAPAERRADDLLRAFSPWDQTRAEAKMADIAGSIHDAVGEGSRLAGQSAPAAASTAASTAASAGLAPVLKSGIEGGRNAAMGLRPEAQSP